MIEERRGTIEIMLCSPIGGFCTHDDSDENLSGDFSGLNCDQDNVFIHRPGLFDRFED